ncbi:MAG: DNA glycosylase [Opitutales bacterium]|jgi:N-glycosylase/DNA lyase|nr:DNA glycosylase [Opitutales bacterium]
MIDSWSPWQIYTDWQPDLNSFKETLDGGQAFCWNSIDEYSYQGVVLNFPLRLRWLENKQVEWSCIPGQNEGAEKLLSTYLGTNKDYRAYYDTLPWRSDSHLKRCIEAYPDLRILGQPDGETLLGFLCSATKQIVQIKEMIQLVRSRFGRPLEDQMNQLPTWADLTTIEESALRACKFGFRAANIHKAAIKIAEEDIDLSALSSQPYEEAKDALCQFPGVGEKVADCTLLFGYHKLEAFPVDTWILKVMNRHYGLDDWSPKQVAHFGRIHFGSYAGLAQQFLFAWERSFGSK